MWVNVECFSEGNLLHSQSVQNLESCFLLTYGQIEWFLQALPLLENVREIYPLFWQVSFETPVHFKLFIFTCLLQQF